MKKTDAKNPTEALWELVRREDWSVDKITRLIREGADINAPDGVLTTPLMYATEYNSNPEILQNLLENGADAAITNYDGMRALDYAERNEALKGTDAYNLLREKTLQNKK